MDGIHDLGGKPGYGKVDRRGEDEVFHERWEAVVYCMVNAAARAGALNLSKSLSQELAPAIRVNSILLGLIDTGQWRRRYEADDTDQTYDEWCADLAADRGVVLERLGRAEEVAPVIALLLSPLASYTTGATIDVAGGVARYV